MALDIKISFSWINYCRLCLQDKGLKIPIFDKEGAKENIAMKIQECLNITTYDGDPLPRMICHQCLCKLNTAYELHLKAVESFRLLLTHLQPLKHVPSVQEYMKDCPGSLNKNEQKEETTSTPIVKTAPAVRRSGPLSKTTNDETHQGNEELHEPIRGRVTRSRIGGKSSLGYQEISPSSQKGSITIVPDIEDPSLTSSAINAPSSSTSSAKDPMFLVPPLPKPKADNYIHSEQLDLEGSEELSKRKRKRITDHYDEALMDTGGNLMLAAGRPLKPRHRENKKKKIGPASRTRALATCLSGPSPWQCVMCSCFFVSHNMLRRHLSNCLICQTCELEFSSAKDKAIHEEAHMYVNLSMLVDLLYKCNMCDRAFAAHLMLKQHIKYDHSENSVQSHAEFNLRSPYLEPNSPDELMCTEDADSCKCDSDEEKKPDDANKSEYKAPEGQEICPKCTRPFVNKQRLTYHLLGHESLIKCSFCPWMFPMGPGRRRHQRRLHGDKADPICFTCSVCRETFETKSILYLHKKSHSRMELEDSNKIEGSKKMELEHCNVCDKMIPASKLMAHITHHANAAYDGSKPHLEEPPDGTDHKLKCQLCPNVSATPEQHRAHVAQKHVQLKSINFTCDGCSQAFANVEAINRHSCPGKETEKQWKNCEHCGQNLSEGISHVCDNECPICHKIFKSARGQRLHIQHKHDNSESVPMNVDSSDIRSTHSHEGVSTPEPGAFENVAVKQERDEEMIEETAGDTIPSVGRADTANAADTTQPSEESLEDLPSTTSTMQAVSDELPSSSSPSIFMDLPCIEKLVDESFPNKSVNGNKGTPKIRLKPSGSLISEPPALSTIPSPSTPTYKKPPPPYRPPLSSTEPVVTKSIVLRKNVGSGPIESYSMVVTDVVGSTVNSMTNTVKPLPDASKSASNPRSDHSYTSNLTPAASNIVKLPVAPTLPPLSPSFGVPVTTPVAPQIVTSVSQSLSFGVPVSTSVAPKIVTTLSLASGMGVPGSISVAPNIVSTVGLPLFFPNPNSSQVMKSNMLSTSMPTLITRPNNSLTLPSNPSENRNPKTETSVIRQTFSLPPQPPPRPQIMTEVQPPVNPANKSQSIRCVQISSLQSVPASSSANFSQISSNQSNIGQGCGNVLNPSPPMPHPTVFHPFQPASGPQVAEENLLRDVLLGRRIRDQDPL